MADATNLLSSVTVGELDLTSRVWMAPLTRSRATMPGNVPNELMAEYYRQRANPHTGVGLIIAEATPVCPRGHGYYATPGIHTDEQVGGWKLVTDAVHAEGGRIFLQLWHVGRVSHSALQPNNDPPVGPSNAVSKSKTYIDETFERHANTPPRALETDEVYEVVDEFRRGAELAKRAGFDGVEIHGANTYLLDQFLRDGMNTRTDEWGGSLENRLRLPTLVAEAVCEVWGAGRVGYRVSPLSEHHDARDSDPAATFAALAERLGAMGLCYLHAVETWDRSQLDERTTEVIPRMARAFKDAAPGGANPVYVANGDYAPAQAERAIETGWCDVVAFGKLALANPDLSERLRRGGPYNGWDSDTFYGGDERGYTDYPTLEQTSRSTEASA